MEGFERSVAGFSGLAEGEGGLGISEGSEACGKLLEFSNGDVGEVGVDRRLRFGSWEYAKEFGAILVLLQLSNSRSP